MRCAPTFLSCLALSLLSFPLSAQETSPATPELVGPEMVWVTYTQGAVKFSPGKNGREQLGKTWIQANPGQVMEVGYTLTTEKGRAELEFEDGSVVYLADNSVLGFEQLWVQGEHIESTVSLLTGTATVWHVQDSAPGKPALVTSALAMYTPTVPLRFVGNAVTRVDCAIDAVRMEEIEGTHQILGDSGYTQLTPGHEVAILPTSVVWLNDSNTSSLESPLAEFHANTVRQPEPTQSASAGDEWDQWVAARMARRRALVAEGLKESGMSEPIPGLADMVTGGKFFDCAPYGRCWQPNNVAGSTVSASAEPAAAAIPANAVRTTQQNSTPGTSRNIVVNRTMVTRCPMQAWGATAQQRNGASGAVQYGPCFAGSYDASQWQWDWDPCRRRHLLKPWYLYDGDWDPYCDVYPAVWVVGRRHHHHPCHMVKARNGVGLVPRHPNDKPGRPPINAKNGVLVLDMAKGHLQAGVEPPSAKTNQGVTALPFSLVTRVDHEVGSAARVERPVIEARMASAILPKGFASEHGLSSKEVTAVHFDYKSGNFVGHSSSGAQSHSTVVGHVGSGGASFGGAAHGSSGGGSSGGGGGGHSGGGSSGGSAAASAGGSSSGGGGGGGGGHH